MAESFDIPTSVEVLHAAEEVAHTPSSRTATYWRYVAERSLKTLVQSAVAMLGVGQTGVIHADWPNIGSVAGAAALVSILTSISVLSGSTTAEPAE